jgi:FkbM family methyltransferase
MFTARLKAELADNIGNRHADNYDVLRYGPEQISWTRRVRHALPLAGLYRLLLRSGFVDRILMRRIRDYLEDLEFFHEKLADEDSRRLLVKLVAYRILGYRRVRLPLSNPDYWAGVESVRELVLPGDSIDVQSFDGRSELNLIDLGQTGVPVRLYYTPKGVHTTFGLPHYDYAEIVAAGPGNTVLDLGGCFGDTTLFFAQRVGPKGRVICFEFIPGNCAVLEKNLRLNESLQTRVELVQRPVWSESGVDVFYRDLGPASKVSFTPFDGHAGQAVTTSLDDYVRDAGIDRVDFIKTDIEGAEPHALRGAEQTLRRWRPKLAISIYHSMEDFAGIVRYLHDLGLGYEFYLGHASIHAEETVLFARPAGRSSETNDQGAGQGQ